MAMRKKVLILAAATLTLAAAVRMPSAERLFEWVFRDSPPAEAVLPTGTLAGSYSIAFETLAAPADPGAGGAIATLGEEVILLTRRGGFYRLDRAEGGFVPLSLDGPVDVAAMEALHDRRIQSTSMGHRDLILREAGDGVEITVSHSAVGESGDCISLAVSRAVLPKDALARGADAEWEEVFRSTPCVATSRGFFLQVGGAIDYGPDGDLRVFVGDFGLDDFSRQSQGLGPQSEIGHLGKIIAIAPDGAARVLSRGHRNPGGLIVTSEGRTLVAEHGPRGGDELNLVTEGANFGWPLETLGTHYGELTWPPAERPGRHDRFDAPLFAWLPSIAVSAMAQISGPEFALWDGDLFLTTLKDGTLRRIRMEDDRVIVDEPIAIGPRVRDIAVAEDGRAYLKLDTLNAVLVLSNANADLEELPRGLAQCAGCHQVRPGDATDYAGPTLVGVIGRRVASVPGYDYTDALAGIGGRWDPNRLASFLRDVQGAAPGSAMPSMDLGPTDIRFIVEGLEALSATN